MQNLAFFSLVLLAPSFGLCSDFPKVGQDIKAHHEKIAAMEAEFALKPTDPNDKEWVKTKLAHMVAIDQYARRYGEIQYQHSYTEAEKTQFLKQFMPRMLSVDAKNTSALKSLLKLYRWFTISLFGEQANGDACLLVQHAEQDPDFQKQILVILEKLYPQNETSRANYAYLWDRVAASWSDPTKRRPQRYGTQGQCVGPGKWEPLPIEDPEGLDGDGIEWGSSLKPSTSSASRTSAIS
jgi:hypothetical protein